MNAVLKYVAALRVWEVTGKIGFVLIGAFFAVEKLDLNTVLILGKIAVYCFINGLAIFSYNAWTGYEADKVNDRLGPLRLLSYKSTGILTLVLSLVSVYIIVQHKLSIILTALGVLLFWIFYSMPNGLKGRPFGGISVSFLTEILLFHLSYLFFSDYSLYSVGISVYFALLVSAGHALHELVDFKADKISDFNTTAVYFGEKHARLIPFLFFALAFTWLLVLSSYSLVDQSALFCFSFANLSILPFCYYFTKSGKYSLFRKIYLCIFTIALLGWGILKLCK